MKTEVVTMESSISWKAWIVGNEGMVATGKTEAEAIGQLLIQYPDFFQATIVKRITV